VFHGPRDHGASKKRTVSIWLTKLICIVRAYAYRVTSLKAALEKAALEKAALEKAAAKEKRQQETATQAKENSEKYTNAAQMNAAHANEKAHKNEAELKWQTEVAKVKKQTDKKLSAASPRSLPVIVYHCRWSVKRAYHNCTTTLLRGTAQLLQHRPGGASILAQC